MQISINRLRKIVTETVEFIPEKTITFSGVLARFGSRFVLQAYSNNWLGNTPNSFLKAMVKLLRLE